MIICHCTFGPEGFGVACHLRMLARANRKKLGKPLIEPQLGNDPDEVDVLDDLDRVLVGDGGEGGGCIAV